MKSKNKFILIFIICLFILIFMISVFIILNVNKDKEHLTVQNEKSINFRNEKVMSFCIDEAKCNTEESVYSDIVYDGKSTKLKLALDKINRDTEKYYQKMIHSDMNDESCAAVRDKYQYSQGTITFYSQYEDKRFINVTVQRIERNVCTNNIEVFQVETIVYDKKTDKLLTQEEFKKELNVQDTHIYNSIKDTLNYLNSDDSEITNYKIENDYNDVVVFYIDDGSLIVSFYQPDAKAYMTAGITA